MEPIIGVGILLGGFLAFNALATPGRVEKTAEKSLRKKFPGATVNVEIEGKRGRDVLNGRFKNVRVELANLKVEGFPIEAGANMTAPQTGAAPRKIKIGSIGHLELALINLAFGDLPVKTALLSFDDVKYDFNALKKHSDIRLISFSNGKIALGVQASALVPVFAHRAPDILDPHVEVRGGDIILSGRRELLGTNAHVVVQGKVVARGQNLELDGARVEVGNVTLMPLLAAPVIKDVNPLYTFDEDGKWPLKLQIENVAAENDTLQIEGALTMK